MTFSVVVVKTPLIYSSVYHCVYAKMQALVPEGVRALITGVARVCQNSEFIYLYHSYISDCLFYTLRRLRRSYFFDQDIVIYVLSSIVMPSFDLFAIAYTSDSVLDSIRISTSLLQEAENFR